MGEPWLCSWQRLHEEYNVDKYHCLFIHINIHIQKNAEKQAEKNALASAAAVSLFVKHLPMSCTEEGLRCDLKPSFQKLFIF